MKRELEENKNTEMETKLKGEQGHTEYSTQKVQMRNQ